MQVTVGEARELFGTLFTTVDIPLSNRRRGSKERGVDRGRGKCYRPGVADGHRSRLSCELAVRSPAQRIAARKSAAQRSAARKSAAQSIVEGPVLNEAVVELIESGASMIVGTRDREMRPECARGLGARVSEDRTRVTVLLNGALSERMRADLADNGRIAVGFSRVHDHRTIQIKGRALDVREGDEGDVAAAERYVIAFSEQVALAGLPRSVVRRVALTPCLVVELEVDEVFDQTPGPGAGEALNAP